MGCGRGSIVFIGMSSVFLLNGDALARLRDLPDNSVHCCVTSPPYFGLRKYDAGENEIGLEETPEAFIASLVAVFREVRRVLREDGTCWIVIGDSYCSTAPGTRNAPQTKGCATSAEQWATMRPPTPAGLKPKDLMMIPARVALALQAGGWYLRSSIVWTKGSCMPESVKDRPTSSHENIFMLAKSQSYFYDETAVEEPSVSDHPSGNGFKREARESYKNEDGEVRGNDEQWTGVGGTRRMRNTWHINPEPLRIKHFAAFPSRLASRCIQVATSEAGVCRRCCAPFKRVVEKGAPDTAHMAACGADSSGGYEGESQKDYGAARAQDASATKKRILEGVKVKITVGWSPTCDCGDVGAPVPAIVLDTFSGAGTTALCASRLGRDAIGIDLNADYNRMAAERISDPKSKCLDTNGVRLTVLAGSVSVSHG